MSVPSADSIAAERRRAWVALAATAGITPRGRALLLARFGEPQAILRAAPQSLAPAAGVSRLAADRLTSGESARRAEALLEQSARSEIAILTPDDHLYPRRLRELPDPPPALWCRGVLDLEAAAIAVVGSRRPSPYGQAMAERVGRELARAGFVVVSGLARGIDGAAHRAALGAGGWTIAVLGCGIDRVYPKEHRELQETIGRHGAVLSEFAPGTPPLPHHFPQRNRLISGLALGVVIVEAGEHSGSLITARLALEQGREVFAVPGNVGTGGSTGTNRLIKAGALLVECVEDIVGAVAAQVEPHLLRQLEPARAGRETSSGATGGATGPSPARGDTPQLTTEELALVEQLSQEPSHMDELAIRSGRPVRQVAALLVSLEIKGRARQLPGNYYCAP